MAKAKSKIKEKEYVCTVRCHVNAVFYEPGMRAVESKLLLGSGDGRAAIKSYFNPVSGIKDFVEPTAEDIEEPEILKNE